MKSNLKTALVEALYNEIVSNIGTYYYFLGKPLPWADITEYPENTLADEAETRKNIVFLKKVTSSDASFVIPRYEWVSGQVYDMYDNRLGDQVVIDVTGGESANELVGDFDLFTFGQGWLVTGTGIPAGTYVDESTPTILTLTQTATSLPESITITKVASSGAQSLEEAKFYIITSNNAVYKCLFNNGGEPSTYQPCATVHEPFITLDGYIWKFMYMVPSAINNKFGTLTDIPVFTTLKSGYYSDGSITSVTIQNFGQDYLPGDSLEVVGNGHLADNPLLLNSFVIKNPGSGYTTTPLISVGLPFITEDFETTTEYLTGTYLNTGSNRIYQVVSGGESGGSSPSHTSVDPVANGSTTMKFVGYKAAGEITLDADSVDTVVFNDGIIGRVNIDYVGTGYNPNSLPEVLIDGDGNGALAVAEVSEEGYITNIIITNRGSGYSTATASIDSPPDGEDATLSVEIYHGYGYSEAPEVVVDSPFIAGVTYANDTAVLDNDVVQCEDRFYIANNSGTLGVHIPIGLVINETEISGDVELAFIGQTASIGILTENTAAIINPIISAGQIIGLIIVDGGEGYNGAAIEIVTGTGSEAVLEANLSHGDLRSRQSNVELLAIPGTIDAFEVLHALFKFGNSGRQICGDGAILGVGH